MKLAKKWQHMPSILYDVVRESCNHLMKAVIPREITVTVEVRLRTAVPQVVFASQTNSTTRSVVECDVAVQLNVSPL